MRTYVRLLTRQVYIHKNFVVNSKNQNSYFGLIVKALRNGVADFTLRNIFNSQLSIKEMPSTFTNSTKRKQKQRE